MGRRKNLNKGHYTIDDRIKNGVEHLVGEHIHFRQEPFVEWESVCGYLLDVNPSS